MSGNRGHSINKLSPEDNVSVVKHPFLEGDNNELRTPEVCLQHLSNVLQISNRNTWITAYQRLCDTVKFDNPTLFGKVNI